MDFLSLFVVALMPVLKVLVVTAIGLFLALDRINILGPSARNHLNNLVFYLFSPMLIGGNLADTITWAGMHTLWFMLVSMLLCFVIGSILGLMLVKITKTPNHLRGLVIGCCSAGNLGNLLLIILPDLCEESGSLFGGETTCTTDAKSYASLSMAVLAVYVWSYVYMIMRASATQEVRPINGHDSSTTINGHNSSININISEGTADAFQDSYIEPLLSSENLENADNSTEDEVLLTEDKISKLERIKRKLVALTLKMNLKMVFSPSTIAAIIGFTIALVTPFRNLMIGDSAPLRVIYSSASFIGEAAIPCITLIVGANLLKGLKGSGASVSVIIGIIVIRFILLPPIGIVIIKGAKHLGLVGSNSLYMLTLMLQFAVPPAMNIGTISQLVKAGQSECSVIMFWTYAVSIFFLTFWLAFFMWLVT